MKLWLRLALRNALRNRRRTALTVGTVLIATTLLTVALAWMQGLFGSWVRQHTAVAGHVRVAHEEFVAREELHPTHENIPDVAPLLATLAPLPGVVAAEPRITAGAVVTVGEEIGEETTLVVGARASYYRDRLTDAGQVARGRWLEAATGEVVLGLRLADRVGATLGDEVLLLSQTQYGSLSPVAVQVVGIVSGDLSLEQQAFVTLEEMEWLVDLEGGALEVLVYAESEQRRHVAPVAAAVAEHVAGRGLVAEAWHEREPWITMLAMINGMQDFVRWLIVFVAALAIFNTMTMAVMERSAEIGVLRAMGLSRPAALGLFGAESLFIGAAGGIGGAAVGSGISLLLTRYGLTFSEDMMDRLGEAVPLQSTVYADLTPDIVVTAVVLGLTMAALGAFLPALRAASIPPVVAMKARR